MSVGREPTPGLGGLQSLLLPAAAVALGLQLLRVFLPGLVWHLGDVRGTPSLTLAGYAFGAFVFVFLAALLRRVAGPELALWLAGAGLVVVRVVEQQVPRPSSDLWLSLAGTALFVLFLPLLVGQVRAHDGRVGGGPRLGFGLLLGLAVDSAIKGAAGTLDLSWIAGPVTFFIVLGLGAAVLWSLVLEPMAEAEAPSEAGPAEAWTLLALGPFLLLEAIVLQDQGWLAQISGWGMSQAFLAVMLGNVAAGLGLGWGLRSGFRWRGPTTLACAVVLVLAFLLAARDGWGVVLLLGLAQAAMGWTLGLALTTAMGAKHPGLGWTTIWLGLGLVLLLVMAFLYYASFNFRIPIPREVVLPASAGIVGLAGLGAAWKTRGVILRGSGGGAGLAAIVGLLGVPLAYWGLMGSPPEASPTPASGSIQVMTYNIHSAFNAEGRQDPEAIAEVIEASGADVVALQEVSRGWLIDGATDLPAWLSRRLGMPFVFRGTADTVWGNAILSRYPILEHGWGDLPLVGTVLPRGYIWARLEVGLPSPLLVINTHLHHVEEEHGPRLAQVSVLLDFWDDRPFTVLLGDLNSRPDFPEMGLFTQAGLIDSWAEAGSGEGLTWPATNPFERIDWVWHTPDLRARAAETLPSTASDHLPAVVTLEIKR